LRRPHHAALGPRAGLLPSGASSPRRSVARTSGSRLGALTGPELELCGLQAVGMGPGKW
ncbi:unnamed protein product, partial [Polarella glacialis]